LYLLEKLKLQPGYSLIATQRGKKTISQQLVNRVHAWGGRFVAKDDKSSNRWYVVDDGEARRKASQTLREDKGPFEQNGKRIALTRKLNELDAIQATKKKKKPKSQLSLQEQKASETLLELNALAREQGDRSSWVTATVRDNNASEKSGGEEPVKKLAEVDKDPVASNLAQV
jgi:hypothetical protein